MNEHNNDNRPIVRSSDRPNTDEINLLEYWQIIKKHKKFIRNIVAVATVLTVAYSLCLKNEYQARAVIMPISGNGGGGMAAMAASMMGGLPFASGLLDGVKSQTSQFMALLKTRTLAEDVINKLDLMKVLYKKKWDEKNNKWKSDNPKNQPTMEDATNVLTVRHMAFTEDKKGGTIAVAALFRDPKLAEKVANGYVEGLQDFINKNSLTVAKRNRIFIEGQLAENKGNLLEMGKEINEFYKGGKISDVESKIDVLQSAKDEFPLSDEDLETLKTDDNKAVVDDVKAKQTELKQHLEQMKMIRGVPQQVYLQYLTLRRELLGKINALLTQQYEMAKIDEAKEDLAFQVIDPARVPERKFKPKRSQIVMMAFVASLFLSIFLAFFKEYLEKMKNQSTKS